ncbi:FmdB family zinc ribbon protein [Trinickia acidisoli]|uniref:FmdB family zinc ribbon protein n=1 Tax=Trinickia acidisoli TaxID=2767482 RepID=UPI001A90458E|nr:FmdB family zinc ribbon protein [Trinickia acidisoli]
MPIYAYRCESCGFAKDVLQKMSDAPLSQCPQCEKDTFRKQVTAAGFQLKGSGWYVTDFRGGSNGSSAGPKADSNAAASSGAAAEKSEAKPEAKSETKSESTASQPASTTAPSASDA